jgi:hypothetical protein
MKTLRHIVSKILRKPDQNKPSLVRAASLDSMVDNVRGMNFTVFTADGGKVIQFSQYDSRTDRTNTRLYIVTDGENLADELAQIITVEGLLR